MSTLSSASDLLSIYVNFNNFLYTVFDMVCQGGLLCIRFNKLGHLTGFVGAVWGG